MWVGGGRGGRVERPPRDDGKFKQALTIMFVFEKKIKEEKKAISCTDS